ncbi:integration host factor, actinobacterial type [Dehalobacterium formicoaceticum]|uniref:Integration host factor n=1 Tax=Dehalobacterium formicoaceticum TaxID=51515 RepID=A0ABT1Y161_9FIRM|nr:integration host factor, actinobacterial type [Dehalobacterium formicoaceticum]MCR6544602.1 integration host factor [Dehalobacterium formicoaceticum]
MAVPELTNEDRNNALAKAQEMRSKRMEIRKQLKSGQLKPAEVLDHAGDDVVARMRVKYLLESLPKIGKVTSRKIMEEIGIDESRRIQGLGPKQKAVLLEKLDIK